MQVGLPQGQASAGEGKEALKCSANRLRESGGNVSEGLDRVGGEAIDGDFTGDPLGRGGAGGEHERPNRNEKDRQ